MCVIKTCVMTNFYVRFANLRAFSLNGDLMLRKVKIIATHLATNHRLILTIVDLLTLDFSLMRGRLYLVRLIHRHLTDRSSNSKSKLVLALLFCIKLSYHIIMRYLQNVQNLKTILKLVESVDRNRNLHF